MNADLQPILSRRDAIPGYQTMVHYPGVVLSNPSSGGICSKLQERWRNVCQRVTRHSIWQPVARNLSLAALAMLLWGNAFTVARDEAGPGGQLFPIGALGVAAYLIGGVVQLAGLPSLLGMLLTGVALRNVGFVVLHGQYLVLAACLRKVALAIILIRAGLGLDPAALKRLSGMVLRLAIVPSLMEASCIAVMTHFLLDLPWDWGFLLGAVMAAVSPAVVVPCLFSLQARGYGRSKGIPTLVIAAASFDDIISISAFGIMLSVIYSTGSMTMTILKGPLGLLGGLLLGVLWGLLLHHLPAKSDRYVVVLRTLLLGFGGMLLLFGSEMIGYDGAGPLGCIVASFAAARGWRDQEKSSVAENFAVLWSIFQPILFGLIGTEIDLYFLDLQVVGLALACLVVALVGRLIVSVAAAAGGNLTLKEKVFVAWAWFPKATVQAAIAPVALDIARQVGSHEDEVYASKVLIVAVLAILVTAPLGAILITLLGPRLLEREPIPEGNSIMVENLDRLNDSIES
ncbi:sodium/hydrogen exchanger 9B2-like [Periplaneta americana]|uniref:sodium/hydrogen exchanger 9B2-like n=1 Tax=Periplaneta americana TaxID=6978 RepID=UPI0037E845B6